MKQYSYIYLLGVGGIGMSALARWFKRQNAQVFGYDRTATALTAQLIQEGIAIHFEDRVELIPKEVLHNRTESLIIYTPALSSNHQLLNYLRKNNYLIYKRSAVLGILTQTNFTIAVAGTHGKTTTSSMIAHLLYAAGKNMIAFLGGLLQGYDSNLLMRGKTTDAPILVVEADEFDQSFLRLHPNWSVITSVEADHLAIYRGKQAVEENFSAFAERVPADGKLIIQQEVATKLLAQAKTATSVAQYALAGSDIRAENMRLEEAYVCFDYISKTQVIRGIKLAMPGYHNVENALAAITVCLALGLEVDLIRQGLTTFQGVQRRFEYIIQRKALVFIDDYAHHPTEITALLRSIRALYPSRKLTAIFQPHLYSRTRDFASGFAQSLCLADEVILLPIYPAREAPMAGVSSQCIFDQMPITRKFLCEKDNLLDLLKRAATLEVLVTIGAGDIDKLVAPIKACLLDERV
ncbi:MAG: UDP-N-acetylmuramate--L-alanine ligase [Cytophagales bacterium]|nr:UDP-N-acetylmuramate--L-alanine ligase [Cytophagales bacterium]